MTVQTGRNELASATRRRLVVLGLLRALATAVVLVALYHLLPLDHITSVPLALAGGLLILLAVIAWQLRAIVRAKEPAVRAFVALATTARTVPLFLLLFASAYFVMARASPANFSTHQLTRTDALYFTVTTFSSRGIRRHHRCQPVRPAGGHRPDDPGPAGPGPGHPRVHLGRAARQAADVSGHRTGYRARAATTARRWYAVTSWRISPNAVDQSGTGGRSSKQAGRGDGSHDRSDG